MTTQTHPRHSHTKANPIGLRALAKLIVFGDENPSVFTEAERLFVDTKQTVPESSNILLKYTSHLGYLRYNSLHKLLTIKNEVLISARLAYNFTFKKYNSNPLDI